jgi:hypothetical protein
MKCVGTNSSADAREMNTFYRRCNIIEEKLMIRTIRKIL